MTFSRLPVGWALAHVGDVLTSIEAGKSLDGLKRPAEIGEVGVLKLSAVSYGEFRPTENKALPADSDLDGVARVQDGDLLISRANTTELVGAVALVSGDYPNLILSDKTLRLVPNERIDSRYLLRALRTREARHHIESRATGTSGSMRNITQQTIAAIQFPLPPLAEQRRIATILDHAEALRAKRREVIRLHDDLIESLFFDVFGDATHERDRWERKQLVRLCADPDDIRCGPFGTQLAKSEYKHEGIPLWGIRNVNVGFRLPTAEFLDENTARRLIQYSLEAGDIVMTRKGTVGNCAIYPTNFPIGIMHSDLLRLRIDHRLCNPAFLIQQLHLSRDVERQLELISGGAIMPGINVTKLKLLEVFVPPIDVQDEFARQVAAIDRLKAAHQASLAKLDELFASLQHRAFRGELTAGMAGAALARAAG
jgi:type I restriction enzyme S subunit